MMTWFTEFDIEPYFVEKIPTLQIGLNGKMRSSLNKEIVLWSGDADTPSVNSISYVFIRKRSEKKSLDSPSGARSLTNTLESTTMRYTLVMDVIALHYLVSQVVSEKLNKQFVVITYLCLELRDVHKDLEQIGFHPNQVAPDHGARLQGIC